MKKTNIARTPILLPFYHGWRARHGTHSANFDEKVDKPQSILIDRGFHILLLMHYNFFGSEGLQGTYMNALNPLNSKLMTSILRGGL